jgi:serine/threonine protein kinase
MAPEWLYNLPITSKVDVYSYGIVVLEMVTGKSPTGMRSSNSGGAVEYTRVVKLVKEKIDNNIANTSAKESWPDSINY